jgi:hypothetical protein
MGGAMVRRRRLRGTFFLSGAWVLTLSPFIAEAGAVCLVTG